jgi:signal transduction histidine kinase
MSFPAGKAVPNPRFAALVDPTHRGEADGGEWTYVRGDGSHVPVHLSVTERTDAAGNAVGYLFVGRDRTRELEVDRLKDEFVGLVSHELRTPLSSILGYLELLRDDDEGELSPSQLQYVGVAERNAKRLLHLVGDLLFTAQVGSGAFQVEPGQVALAAVIHASVESAAPVARAAGVTLTTDIDDLGEEIVTPGDAMRLGQAVDNLVSNALKFTRRGGTVTLGLAASGLAGTQAAEAGRVATITVADTGIGIPADELDKLFGRFFRATTATRQAIPGVGLGLVITRAIVQAHGGTMRVQSKEGVGTTFIVSLPLAQPAPSLSASRP